MNRAVLAAAVLLPALAACSQQTQDNASEAAELAADDIEANAQVVGEVIEEGAKNAAGAVADGAADLEQHIEEGDKRSPEPAPILGDELNADKADRSSE